MAPVRHRNYGNYSELKDQLSTLHKARIADDPDYRYLVEQIALNDKYTNITSLSLNENTRRSIIDQDTAARNAIENTHRLAKGLPAKDFSVKDDIAAKEQDVTEEASSEESKTNNEKVTDKKSDKESDKVDQRTDFLLTETSHILLDAIQLMKQKNNQTDKSPLASYQ